MKKVDRRTLYTRQVIKDTLLKILTLESFNKINVSKLCRAAEITRATFYLHYQDIYAVVDDILNEALGTTDTADIKARLQQLFNVQKEHGHATSEKIREIYDLLPICQRISDRKEFRPLFLDSYLSTYILQYIIAKEKDHLLPFLQEYYQIDETLAKNIYYFTISGAYAINQRYNWEKNESWFQFQAFMLNLLSHAQPKDASKKN